MIEPNAPQRVNRVPLLVPVALVSGRELSVAGPYTIRMFAPAGARRPPGSARLGGMPPPEQVDRTTSRPNGYVQTVEGPLAVADLGFVLPHEHTRIQLWQIPNRWDYWELTPR